jgi:hypothetical protein
MRYVDGEFLMDVDVSCQKHDDAIFRKDVDVTFQRYECDGLSR